MKSKSFINQANKNATRNFDAKKLDPIQTILLRYGISTVREREIYHDKFETKNKIRVPDLIDTRYNIIFEHDTVKVHCELGFEVVENDRDRHRIRTRNRNGDYKRAGINFVVINEDLCKELNLDESKLAVYLYYHKLMEIKNAKQL